MFVFFNFGIEIQVRSDNLKNLPKDGMGCDGVHMSRRGCRTMWSAGFRPTRGVLWNEDERLGRGGRETQHDTKDVVRAIDDEAMQSSDARLFFHFSLVFNIHSLPSFFVHFSISSSFEQKWLLRLVS